VRVAGLTCRQAGDLLDWLENHGCIEVGVELDKAGGFGIRFAPPPGTGVV
jgi:hypothetical protein